MIRVMRSTVFFSVLALAGCSLHIDRSVTLKSGVPHGSVYSLDGDVHVQPSARARKISVVDGNILLGNGAHTARLRSVDGSIELDPGAVCTGDIQSVAGRIRLGDGVRVSGDVRTVTGTLDADNAIIDGQLETVAGRVRLTGGTHLAKGILLSKPDPDMTVNNHEEQRLPVLIIGPGVAIDGPIKAERGGVLKVSRQAKIGAVTGIAVQWFDGAAPDFEPRPTHAEGGTTVTVSTSASTSSPNK